MKNKAWLVTTIVLLSGIVGAITITKVPPVMVAVLEDMNTGITMGGWLMSVPAISGILLALPSGGIMVKIGPKKLGLFALFCMLVSNLMGAVAPNFSVLMLSRLFDGIGMSLVGVIAPAIISQWFPPEKRGLPMSLWSVCIGVGMFLIFTISNFLLPYFGWRGNWYFTALFAAIIFVLFAMYVDVPKSTEDRVHVEENTSFIEGVKSPLSWLLCFMFIAIGFGMITITTYAPTFLVEVLQMSPSKGNSYSSVITFGMIFGGIGMGFVINRVKNRSLLLLVSMILTVIGMGLTFEVTNSQLIMPYFLMVGLIYSMVPAVIFTVAPEAATTPNTVGVTMGIIVLGQNLGGFITPVTIGAIVESSGSWHSATLPLILIGLIGIALSVLYMNSKKPQMLGAVNEQKAL